MKLYHGEIIAGKGISNVSLNMSKSELIEIIGTDYSVEQVSSGELIKIENAKFWVRDGKVTQICVYGDYCGKYESIIGIGSTLTDVKKYIGDYDYEPYVWYLPEIPGICFELEDTEEWDESTAPIERIYVYSEYHNLIDESNAKSAAYYITKFFRAAVSILLLAAILFLAINSASCVSDNIKRNRSGELLSAIIYEDRLDGDELYINVADFRNDELYSYIETDNSALSKIYVVDESTVIQYCFNPATETATGIIFRKTEAETGRKVVAVYHEGILPYMARVYFTTKYNSVDVDLNSDCEPSADPFYGFNEQDYHTFTYFCGTEIIGELSEIYVEHTQKMFSQFK